MTLWLVGLFLAAIAALGLSAARKKTANLADYVLAGRALTLPSFVVTLVPTFYGSALGIGEFTWRSGLVNWTVMALPYYVFAAVYAVFLAGRVRLQPGMTIPDHLENAYGREMAIVGALLVFVLALPADDILMAGVLLSHLGGLAMAWAMAAAAALALVVLWRGGLPSDVAANRLQIVLMFGGFACIIPAALRALPPAQLRAALPPGHLSWGGGLGPARLITWWLIAVWTLVDPSFHQRCAAADSPATARRGILISICLWALYDLMTTSMGLYGRALQPAISDPLLSFPSLADRLLGPAARGLFYAGLAASLTSALQGHALQSAISLGKDAVGRLLLGDGPLLESAPRRALPIVLGAAWLLAHHLPSVVGLWYAIGSAVIPGLLLPLLGVYFPRWRVSGRRALTASVAGCGLAALWLAARGRAPIFDAEPMFPGLAAALFCWLAPPGSPLGRRGQKV